MKVESVVHAVTVFTDRARITRRGQVELPTAGLHRLQVMRLPETLDRDSVRVAARGPVGTRLFSVDFEWERHVKDPGDKGDELLAQLQTLKDELAVVDEQMENMKHRLAAVDKLIDSASIYAKGLANGRWTRDQQAATFDDFYRDRERCQAVVRNLAPRKRQVADDIARVQRKIDDLHASLRTFKSTNTISVEIEVSQPGLVELDVSYQLLKVASWQPLYDLRWRSGRLELAYLASVQQLTGEEWKQVQLSLSTARPGTATAVPRLEPWNIGPSFSDFDHGPQVMMSARMGAAAPDSDAVLSVAPAAKLSEASVATSQVSAAGLAVTYQLPGSADIPNDNSPHKVTVGRFELNPKVEFVAVPRLNSLAMRRVKAILEGSFTLLAGPAMIFDGDDFLGRTEMALTTPGQEFKLFFGVEPRIRIERRQTKREVSRTFMGGKRRIHFGYEVQIDSGVEQPAELVIVDHLPRARHEDIKVTVAQMDPKPAKQADDGILIWRVNVPARGKMKLQWEFVVEHPKDMAVAGLE